MVETKKCKELCLCYTITENSWKWRSCVTSTNMHIIECKMRITLWAEKLLVIMKNAKLCVSWKKQCYLLQKNKQTNKWLYVILDFIGGYVNHSFQCVLLWLPLNWILFIKFQILVRKILLLRKRALWENQVSCCNIESCFFRFLHLSQENSCENVAVSGIHPVSVKLLIIYSVCQETQCLLFLCDVLLYHGLHNPELILSRRYALKWFRIMETGIKYTLYNFLCFLLAYISDT